MTPLLTELKKITERAEKATPGPWNIGHRANRVVAGPRDNTAVANCVFTTSAAPYKNNPSAEESCLNADFIAASRTDVPRLVAAIHRLIEQRDGYVRHVLGSSSDSKRKIKAFDAEIIAILEGEK
jgi:hypothetical protein